MEAKSLNISPDQLAGLDQEKQGMLVFGREGKIDCINGVAAGFLTGKEWAVEDGWLRQATTRQKENHLDMIRFHFLTTISHEFRTPLSTVLSSLALAENYLSKGHTSLATRHLVKIRQAALQINCILSDFLSLSKLEEGGLVEQPEPFELALFFENLIREMQQFAKPGQHLLFQTVETPCKVILDKRLLREVITNLLRNAIKYSEAPVIFSFNCAEGVLEIQVKDKGIGIPEAEQKFIFEQFFRANNAMHIPGTGIGLNLTRKYLELMNGVIGFESTQGIGSLFYVKIPVVQP